MIFRNIKSISFPRLSILLFSLVLFSCAVGPDERLDNPSDPLSPAYAPLVPEVLYATVYSDTLVVLEWYENAAAEQGFHVYRKSDLDPAFRLIGVVQTGTTYFRDTERKVPGITYTYRLFSYAGVHESLRYVEATAKVAVRP